MENITEKLMNLIRLEVKATKVVVSEDFYEILKRKKQNEIQTPEKLGEFTRIMGVQLIVNKYLPYNYLIIGKNGIITKG